MPAFNIEKYWQNVYDYRKIHGDQQREGQILFNVFAMMMPDMSHFACGKPLDPFYDDERIPLFLDFIEHLVVE